MRQLTLTKIKCAFTLVEMLVVISIIGILAAMMLPALMKAQSMALLVSCQSNQKQIFTAFSMYSADNDGQYPVVRLIAPSAGNGWFYGDWQWSLSSYTGRNPDDSHSKDWRKGTVFWCTAAVVPTPNSNPVAKSDPLREDNNTYRYAMNSVNDDGGHKISKFNKISQTALVTDTFWSLSGVKGWDVWNNCGNIPHNYGMSVLFYDGHTQWREFNIVSIPENSNDIFWKLQ